MYKRVVAASAAGLVTVMATALPAAAIKYGEPDAGEHPYVGMMYGYAGGDLNGDGLTADDELFLVEACSGTRLDDDTFLTAGHCTYDIDAVAIWYGDDLRHLTAADVIVFADAMEASDAHSYTALTHPLYSPAAFDQHDSGVVDKLVLAEGVTSSDFGALPELGYWNEQIGLTKNKRDSLTTVGYGLQWSVPVRGKSDPPNSNARQSEALPLKLTAHGELIGFRQFGAGKTNDAYVVLTNNAHTGGTCFGDSGGPTFISGTNTIGAVTSFGTDRCTGTTGVHRIDTAAELAWLASFVE